MELIARRLTAYFIKKKIIQEADYDTYLYGFVITIFSAVSNVVLLLYAAIFSRFAEICVFLAVFSCCQTHGGGYHAQTHCKCLCTMLTGVSGCILLLSVDISAIWLFVCAVCALFMLIKHPLVLHHNKRYLESKKRKYITASYRMSIICFISCVALYLTNVQLGSAGCWALVYAAISRIVGLILANRRCIDDNLQ